MTDPTPEGLRERIAEALYDKTVVRQGYTAPETWQDVSEDAYTKTEFRRTADAVLDALGLEQVPAHWCPVHRTALCPELYMLKPDGTTAAGYHSHWSEELRCGRREPVFVLRKGQE